MDEKFKKVGTVALAVLILVIGSLGTTKFSLPIADYRSILSEDPDQDFFVLQFESHKGVQILTRPATAQCEFGLIKIYPTYTTVKCGSRVAVEFETVVDYWRTYGQGPLGEEAWWKRNYRKARLINFEVLETSSGYDVIKTIPLYKGRSGSDGVLKEIYKVSNDEVKILYDYEPASNAKHRIGFKIRKIGYGSVDPYDSFGLGLGSSKENGKLVHWYGGKAGKLLIDPIVVLYQPAHQTTSFKEGDSVVFVYNCTAPSTANITNSTIFGIYNRTMGVVNLTAWNTTEQAPASGGFSAGNVTMNRTLPTYVDVWPIPWYVRCYFNQSVGNANWIDSATRMIQMGVAESTATLSCDYYSRRSDQSVSCNLSSITNVSKRHITFIWNLTNSSLKTDGGDNATFFASGNLSNSSYSISLDDDRYNITKGMNVTFYVRIFNGAQNSSWIEASQSINVSDGYPSVPTIVHPEEDLNYENNTENILTAVNWTASVDPDGSYIYYNITIYNETGRFKELNDECEFTGVNTSTWTGGILANATINCTNPGTLFLNLSWLNMTESRYKWGVMACDNGFSTGLCRQDNTTNLTDIVSWKNITGPTVSAYRIFTKSASASLVPPIGQTDDVGIWKILITPSTARGNISFYIGDANVTGGGASAFCVSGTYCNASSSKTRSNVVNVTNQTGAFDLDFTSGSKYIWCWHDLSSCGAGQPGVLVFNFSMREVTG